MTLESCQLGEAARLPHTHRIVGQDGDDSRPIGVEGRPHCLPFERKLVDAGQLSPIDRIPDSEREIVRRGDNALTRDRKSTRLNSSHSQISYAVFCLNTITVLAVDG